MKEMTYVEAINEALHEELQRDEKVFVAGEDICVGYGGGGIFGATKGLKDRFGTGRVIDTPLSESALAGFRPIVEIMFMDFFTISMDQLVNNAAKMRWCLDGKVDVPVVYRTAYGGGAFLPDSLITGDRPVLPGDAILDRHGEKARGACHRPL